jgi:ADP-ribose pyrophosphatase YjhB (NUDIX family)
VNRYHPQKDDKGHPVPINNPSQASSLSSWGDANLIATAIPGSPMPESIGFIDIRSWKDAPSDSAGWEVCVQSLRFDEPELKVKPGKSPASGAVIIEKDGRVWVVSPTNGYAGYKNTFPKGRVSDLSLRANALKEVYEESGLQVELIRFLTDSERSTTTTRYYLARCIGGNPADMGWESQAVHLVPQDQLARFVTHKNDAVILRALADIQTIATKYSWEKLKPMPKRHTIIQLDFKLNAKQAGRVRQGFIPSMMEEKWFLYFDDNTLYQHRSWTGVLIDQIHFVEDGNGLRATHAEVNRYTPDYSNKDDKEDRERIAQMVMELANSPFGAKSNAVDPMVSALEVAVEPNYLGSPDVIKAVLSPYFVALIGVWRSHFDKTPPVVTFNDKDKALFTLQNILSGNDPAYVTMPWHSVEQLGQAAIKYLNLNAEYCAGESLYFIIDEGLASVALKVNKILQTYADLVDPNWERDAEPVLNRVFQFVEAVLLGTNELSFPSMTLEDIPDYGILL